MPVMKKITVDLPEDTLASAQRASGAGTAETIRQALKEFVHRDACRRLLALRGTVDLDIDLNELRKDKDEA